jgi:hypothetical protein
MGASSPLNALTHTIRLRRVPIAVTVGVAYIVLCLTGAAAMQGMRPSLIVELPAPLLLVLATAFSVTFACVGQWYVHHRFHEQGFVRHNEVGGYIIAVAGAIYAVVLGFLTVAAWQHFATARDLVAMESAADVDAWHMALDLPGSRRARVRTDVLTYAELMVSQEWPAMRNGSYDTQGDVIVMNAMSAAGAFTPANFGESNSQSATLSQLGVLHDVRQRRLSMNASGIAPFEWLVLVVGAFCIVAFCWLFGLVNQRVHMMMTGSVALLVTSLLVLLFELQYPFRTDLGISPYSWNVAIEHIHVMLTGSQMDMRM